MAAPRAVQTLLERLATLHPLYTPTFSALCYILMLSGVAACVALCLGITAPYGKHHRQGWGIDMDARLAWFSQEIWSLVIPLGMIAHRVAFQGLDLPWTHKFLACMFLGHYVQRSIVYPLLMNPSSRPMPVSIWAMSVSFCVYNGYLQGTLLTTPFKVSTEALVGGFVLWLSGLLVNLHSDAILRRLRRLPGDGYKIPRGGMFEYVSGANFFGECVEWTGYAVATGLSLPAVTFSLFTWANIGPRALHHHQWYLSKFKETYPKDRKALVPFVL